jgi:hypothetical protein
MRKAWRGHRRAVRLSHNSQKADVAEISYGEPVIGKPEYPDNYMNHPAMSDSGLCPSNALDK